MDPHPKITELLDLLTRELKHDRELQSEIREELHSHLEENIDIYREEGLAEEESIDKAIKAFGPSEEIAAELVAANRKRMQIQAWMKLLCMRALLPLALLLTLFLCYRTLNEYAKLDMLGNISPSQPNTWMDFVSPKTPVDLLPPEKKFLFTGDLSRQTKAQQIRAIHEKFPHSFVYFGYYITHLHVAKSDPELIISELERGKRLEPDNARYHYLHANLLFEKACTFKGKKFELVDQNHFDLAISQLLEGTRKPYYKTYTQDMLKEQLDCFEPSKKVSDLFYKIYVTAGAMLPDLGKASRLPTLIAHQGRVLAERGKSDPDLMDAWHILSRHLNENAFSLIELLVSNNIVKEAQTHLLPIIKEHYPQKAEKSEHAMQQILLKQQDLSERKYGKHNAEVIKKHASILSSMFMPAIDQYSEKEKVLSKHDFNLERKLEYLVCERMAFLVLSMIFCLASLALIAARVVQRLRSGKAFPKYFLMPEPQLLLQQLFLTNILPLIVYIFYSRYTLLNARDEGVAYASAIFFLELSLVCYILVCTNTHLALGWIKKRCEQLNLATPRFKTIKITTHFHIALAGIVYLALARKSLENLTYIIAAVFILISLARLFMTLFSAFRLRKGKESYDLTANRSLVPYMVFPAIVLCLVSTIVFDTEEKKYIQKLDAATYANDQVGFSHHENEIVNEMKQRMIATIKANPL